VIVTAILTPLLTSWWFKRVTRKREAEAAAAAIAEDRSATVTGCTLAVSHPQPHDAADHTVPR
jgi:hypothetical protein